MKLNSLLIVASSALALLALPSLRAEPVLNLSDAHGFNLLTWNDATLLNSDTEGSVAVGRNASFGSYSVADKLPVANSHDPVLVVGGNLSAAGGGQVYHGSIYVGGTYTGPGYDLNSAPGSVVQSGLGKAGVPFDFGAAQTALTAKSASYGAATANGTSQLAWSTLTLTGTDADLNIFNIDGATLHDATGLVINVTAGSHVLINVSGTSVDFGNMGISGSFDVTDTLFNFYQATTLSMTGIAVEGSVLAPLADVSFTSGQLNGQLIANSFAGASWGVGQVNYHNFNDQKPTHSVPDSADTGLLVVLGLVGALTLKRAVASHRK